jgi:membrane dipeptidase
MALIEVSNRAREVHQRAIVLDGHIDTVIKNLAAQGPANLGQRRPDMHLDLPRMMDGGVTGGFVMVGGHDLVQGLRLVDRVYEEAAINSNRLTVALNGADVRRAKADGKVAFIMETEGAWMLHEQMALLHVFQRLGVRMVGPTHGEGGEPFQLQGEKSLFGYCDLARRDELRRTQKGLTSFARELLAEMNRTGLILDLAHANDAAFYEALDLYNGPPLFSHGNCFALSPHSRNLTDDQLKALAAKGGVLCISFYAKFVDKDKATFERLLDHFSYAAELVGIEHVGVGSDYDGCSATVIPEVSQMPTLTEGLLRRGFSEEDTLRILGGNLLRVLEAVVG